MKNQKVIQFYGKESALVFNAIMTSTFVVSTQVYIKTNLHFSCNEVELLQIMEGNKVKINADADGFIINTEYHMSIGEYPMNENGKYLVSIELA